MTSFYRISLVLLGFFFFFCSPNSWNISDSLVNWLDIKNGYVAAVAAEASSYHDEISRRWIFYCGIPVGIFGAVYLLGCRHGVISALIECSNSSPDFVDFRLFPTAVARRMDAPAINMETRHADKRPSGDIKHLSFGSFQQQPSLPWVTNRFSRWRHHP